MPLSSPDPEFDRPENLQRDRKRRRARRTGQRRVSSRASVDMPAATRAIPAEVRRRWMGVALTQRRISSFAGGPDVANRRKRPRTVARCAFAAGRGTSCRASRLFGTGTGKRTAVSNTRLTVNFPQIVSPLRFLVVAKCGECRLLPRFRRRAARSQGRIRSYTVHIGWGMPSDTIRRLDFRLQTWRAVAFRRPSHAGDATFPTLHSPALDG